MRQVIDFLIQKYAPSAFILYGSYADGSSSEHSDFDALLIADLPEAIHDTSFWGSVPLDVFVYPPSHFEGEVDAEEILQIHDGRLLLDALGQGERLMRIVHEYLLNFPKKSRKENEQQVKWCQKMLLRAERGDAEGFFRWHWLVCDSLQMYCDLSGVFYFGPKKALKYLLQTDPKGYGLYTEALKAMDYASLRAWIDYLSQRTGA